MNWRWQGNAAGGRGEVEAKIERVVILTHGDPVAAEPSDNRCDCWSTAASHIDPAGSTTSMQRPWGDG